MIKKLMQNDINPDAQQKKMSDLISGVPSTPSNDTNSVVTSQENITSVSASFSALPGIQISGNSVVNVHYNQVATQYSVMILHKESEKDPYYQYVTSTYIIFTIYLNYSFCIVSISFR